MMQKPDSSVFNAWSASSQQAMKSNGRADYVRGAEKRMLSDDGAWTYRRMEDRSCAYAVILNVSEPSEELDIPAEIDGLPVRELASSAFAGDKTVRCIHLPATLEKVEEGAFRAAPLEQVEVDEGNRFFSSDGNALFDAAGTTLLKLLTRSERYAVPEGCRKVSDAAFKGRNELSELVLPKGLTDIGAYAFFQTGIQKLEFPGTLKNIGKCAFSGCRALRSVRFNEGLSVIGMQAFAHTALSAVQLPSSLEQLGARAFEHTDIDFLNERLFSISPANASLFVKAGVLYQRTDTGFVASELLCPDIESCSLPATTVEIAESAFEGARKLSDVSFPEGLRCIGRRAFRGCASLKRAKLPDSLLSLGEEAFDKTALEQVYLGSSLEHMGAAALETVQDEWGAGKASGTRSLISLEISEANERFSLIDGMLLERTDEGLCARLLCDPPSVVRIPLGVTEVSDMAFAHARISELHIPATLKKVGQKAFLGIDGLELLHIDFPHEIDGVTEVSLVCPGKARDPWDFSRAFCMDADGLFFDFAAYDGMAVFEHDMNRVVEMALCRLATPVKLSGNARANYESTLARLIRELDRQVADGSSADSLRARTLLAHIKRMNDEGVFAGCLEALARAIDEIESC